MSCGDLKHRLPSAIGCHFRPLGSRSSHPEHGAGQKRRAAFHFRRWPIWDKASGKRSYLPWTGMRICSSSMTSEGVEEARRLGLTVTGTLGVLELAAERALIDLPAAVGRLQATNFRAAPHVIRAVLERDAYRQK